MRTTSRVDIDNLRAGRRPRKIKMARGSHHGATRKAGCCHLEETRDYRLTLSKFRLKLIFRYGRSAGDPNALSRLVA
jgi:hypothetical protein